MTTPALPAEIRHVFDNGLPAVMVTCSADGVPNVTVISQVYFVDEHHAALSFQFFSKTIRNVRENPRAYLCVSDIATLVGIPRVAGRYALTLEVEDATGVLAGLGLDKAGTEQHLATAG